MPKPLKVPSLARSVPKPLKVPSLARSGPKLCVGEAGVSLREHLVTDSQTWSLELLGRNQTYNLPSTVLGIGDILFLWISENKVLY